MPVAVVCVALAASTIAASASSASETSSTLTLSQCQSAVRHQTLVSGKLTLATDNPVQPPWYEHNQPSNATGYEGALAYKIATKLGFTAKNVVWTTEPFAQSFQPGSKPFDMDLNEIAYTATRAKNVTFSVPYYELQQSLVAMRTNRIVKNHSPSALSTYLYGAVAGSTSLTYATTHIKPTHAVKSYATLGAAEVALKAHAIDALVIDTPTGNTVVNWFLSSNSAAPAVQFGQFTAVGDLYYAAVMKKASSLAACVNVAINAITQGGGLQKLKTTWLGAYNQVPLIQP